MSDSTDWRTVSAHGADEGFQPQLDMDSRDAVDFINAGFGGRVAIDNHYLVFVAAAGTIEATRPCQIVL